MGDLRTEPLHAARYLSLTGGRPGFSGPAFIFPDVLETSSEVNLTLNRVRRGDMLLLITVVNVERRATRAHQVHPTFMQLYLSSYRFGNCVGRLRAMASGGAAVVIANALDYTDDLARKDAGTAREIGELARVGFTARELDLRSCFGRPEVLREQLANVALIWVVGGSAFLLRRALKLSGLDAYLLARRADASLVYGGYSAGAVVATPTLRGIELVDPPDVIATGYDPEIVWDGVGLLPYSIAPHYKSQHPDSEAIDKVVHYFIDNQMLFKALRDGEVIISQG
jgi:dipeptidase E